MDSSRQRAQYDVEAERTEPLPDGSLLAAIDIGSNSFHLIITRIEHGEIRPLEILAEKVQLGAGLENGYLTEDAMQRGLDCLARFAQLLGSIDPERVRAVGTNALRLAKNRLQFTARASQILGIRVDVIYGREEARLVYLGVAHTLADDANSRLVIDIGGGSTEFIIGERFEPRQLESLQMGCVSYSKICFPEGVISPDNYRRAYNRARVETSHIRNGFNAQNWSEAVGSSGTLNAIDGILSANGWSDAGITRDGLKQLEEKLLSFNRFEDIELTGLSENRRNVIVAGVAITTALFDILNIPHMRTSKGALREGVIYDLMGRLSHEDVRERTINALVQRYSADEATTEMVERRCSTFFSAARGSWSLKQVDWDLLHWAARTHEIGMAISHKHYNRHSAYLLRNADLPGFSQEEQEQLAILTQAQRGKINDSILAELPEVERPRLRYLLVLFRLAMCFKYVEVLEQLPDFAIAAQDDALSLGFPENWLLEHPLTLSELEQEQQHLTKLGIQLDFI